MSCPNCGAYNFEQHQDTRDHMFLRCLSCNYEWEEEKYREDGEDFWRNPEYHDY